MYVSAWRHLVHKLCYAGMIRSRLLVLGVLLVGSAVSVFIYQVSNAEFPTKILPSHPLHRENSVAIRDETVAMGDGAVAVGDEVLPTADGPEEDGNLERLGQSEMAHALRQQAIANRKHAAALHMRQKQLDSEIFKFKIEKSHQAGLRKRLEEDLQNLKHQKRIFKEERKEFALERIYHRHGIKSPIRVRARDHGLTNRNSLQTSREHSGQVHPRKPLSVQGSSLKVYLKQMNRNFRSNSHSGVSNVNGTAENQAGGGASVQTVNREGKLLREPAPPGGGGVAAAVAAPGGVLAKLPLIEDIVQQGHFGYEHGRNGKDSSQQKPAGGGRPTAKGAPQSSNEAVEVATASPKPFDPNDLWEGRNPAEVVRRWDGIMLDGNYMLRPFVDVDDKRASGMEGRPQSIDYMSEGAAEERFYQLVTVDHVHCGDLERMGNYGDGGWDMCVAPPYKPGHDCLVYSFGINNDFSFDDGISNKYGCDVKAFDPSMFKPHPAGNPSDMSVGDHMHSSKVHFFNLGLGAADGINKQAWQLRTLGSILKRLGHSNRVIDFLKVDIEFNEWDCLHTALVEHSLRNVKQLVFEIHTSEVYTVNTPSHKENFLRWYNILLGLEKQGFRRYHHHFNPSGQYTSVRTGKDRTCCYELYYINIRFLK